MRVSILGILFASCAPTGKALPVLYSGEVMPIESTVEGSEGPCDIYEAGKTPCVAAHSTVRALYGAFSGALYQVRRASGETYDIPTISAGGFANSAVQDAFCAGTSCVISRIYDQSPEHNHLDIAPPGGAHNQKDTPCNATKERLLIGGHPVYAAYFEGGMGYRIDNTSGIAKGDEPESMYMVTSGTHYNNACCFDYGNAETDNHDDGAGTMEAVYFGSAKGGLNHGGSGSGPWIMADMENALWGADKVDSEEPPINHTFVTAMVKGDASPTSPGPAGAYQEGVDYAGNDIAPCAQGCVLPKDGSHLDCESKCNATANCAGYVFADASCSGQPGPVCWTKATMQGQGTQKACRNSRILHGSGSVKGHWAIKGGDAQSGGLKVYWDGPRAPGYAPMKKQGAIILGIGGDNSDGATGTFYEGVMTKGYSTSATDDAVQANIVAAGYAQQTPSPPSPPPPPPPHPTPPPTPPTPKSCPFPGGDPNAVEGYRRWPRTNMPTSGIDDPHSMRSLGGDCTTGCSATVCKALCEKLAAQGCVGFVTNSGTWDRCYMRRLAGGSDSCEKELVAGGENSNYDSYTRDAAPTPAPPPPPPPSPPSPALFTCSHETKKCVGVVGPTRVTYTDPKCFGLCNSTADALTTLSVATIAFAASGCTTPPDFCPAVHPGYAAGGK